MSTKKAIATDALVKATAFAVVTIVGAAVTSRILEWRKAKARLKQYEEMKQREEEMKKEQLKSGGPPSGTLLSSGGVPNIYLWEVSQSRSMRSLLHLN